ncbi:hypothetical protein [Halobacillus shinanisalinarum]
MTGAEQAKVPVVIHLEHAYSLEIVIQCLQAGYTSEVRQIQLPF